jgi:predicted enzyme related to lactoylglutathione lyase
MARVVHFEIHTEDAPRAIQFYEQVFGWQFTKWSGPMEYWMVITGADQEPGINGGLTIRRGACPQKGQPVNAYVCTIQIDNLDAILNKAIGVGAEIALEKMPIPGVGWLAYVHDPDGNLIGLMQNDTSA